MEFTPFVQTPPPNVPKVLVKRGWENAYELSIFRYLYTCTDFSNRSNPTDWDAIERLLLKALDDVRKIKEEQK